MSDTLQLVFANVSKEATAFGDSTSTFNVSRLQTDGSIVVTPEHYVDSAVVPLSTAVKSSLGLTGTKYVDDGLNALKTGTAMQYASTSQNGQVYRMSAAPAVASQPIAVEQNDAVISRILSVNQYAGVTGMANAPDVANPFLSALTVNLQNALRLGSGKDGNGILGAIAASSTAPTITSTSGTGLLTLTATYKIAAYNLSGAIVASSASASTGALTTKQVVLTFPSLPAKAMGWKLFRSTDGVNYYQVGIAVKGFNYFETGANAFLYTDNVPNPNTSNTAPGSDTTGTTATMSGQYEFISLDLTGATTITVATTGVYAGQLRIRVQGTFTPASGCTFAGTGANQINTGSMRRFVAYNNNLGMFVGQWASDTLAPTAVSGAAITTTGPYGIGSDCSQINQLLSGWGTKGNVSAGTGGNGGFGGALIQIWAYQCVNDNLVGTFTVTGQAGAAGSGNAAQGGGGGSGGILDFGFVVPWKDSATENANGGAGGNASGATGATTITGSPGGGGGAIIRRNCYDTTGATATVAAGSNGSNTAVASGAVASQVYSGGHYGTGGVATGSSAVVSATAGQTFAFNGLNDPSWMFAA